MSCAFVCASTLTVKKTESFFPDRSAQSRIYKKHDYSQHLGLKESQGLQTTSCSISLLKFWKKPPRTQMAKGEAKKKKASEKKQRKSSQAFGADKSPKYAGKQTRWSKNGRKLVNIGLQPSNVPRNENLADRQPVKPIDFVEKYQKSLNRRSWRSECLFSPTHTALLIFVKSESKLNEDLKKKKNWIVKWVIWGFLFFWGAKGDFGILTWNKTKQVPQVPSACQASRFPARCNQRPSVSTTRAAEMFCVLVFLLLFLAFFSETGLFLRPN